MTQDLFELCRTVNPFLGFGAFVFLCWRLGPALVWMSWQDRAARVLFAGYVVLAAAGAWQSMHFDNQPGPASAGFSLLHLGVIVLMSVWKPTQPPPR